MCFDSTRGDEEKKIRIQITDKKKISAVGGMCHQSSCQETTHTTCEECDMKTDFLKITGAVIAYCET